MQTALLLISLASSVSPATATPAPPPLPTCPEDRGFRHIEPSPFFHQDRTLFLVKWGYVTVWRSSDDGQTWREVFMAYGSAEDFEIAPLPTNPDLTIYLRYNDAGAYPLVRSTDSGDTWQERTSCGSNCVHWVGLSATNQAETIFAARGRRPPFIEPPQGLLRSDDGALTWRHVWTETAVRGAAPSPDFSDDRTVLALLYSRSSSLDTYLIASTDGGDTWEARGQQGLCDAPLAQLVFSPNFAHDRTLFARQRGSIFKSVDAGFSWRHLYPRGEPPCAYHEEAEAEGLQLSPDYASDRTLFITTSGGTLYASYDDGHSWYPLAQADRIDPFFSVRRRPDPTLTTKVSQATLAPLAARNWPITHPLSSSTPLTPSLYFPLIAVVQPPPPVHTLYFPLILAHGPLPRPLTIFITTGWIRHSHYRSDDGGLTWQCLNVPPEPPWPRRTRP